MAIQNRRGQAVDFVPSKMLPGEFAVSLDNRKLYMCFASGTVKEVALTDDVTQAISAASTSLGGRIAVLESASTEQGATLLALVTRMGTAEAAIRSHDGRLVVLENDGTNIKARLSDVESETATLDELLTDMNMNMIMISNDVEGLKSNAVRFDTVQNKSAAQKLQARENTDSAGIASLATAYSPSARYAVGDMVTYDGKLYTCKTAITTAEAWNSSHWTEVTVGDQLSDLKDDLKLESDYIDDIAERLLPDVVLPNNFIIGTRFLENGFSSAATYARNRDPYPAGTYHVGPITPGFMPVKYISDSQGVNLYQNWSPGNTDIVSDGPFYINFASVTDASILNNINANFIVTRSLSDDNSDLTSRVNNIEVTVDNTANTIDDAFDTIYPDNCYDGTKTDGGYISESTGAVGVNSNYAYTDFIELLNRGNKNVIISSRYHIINSAFRYAFYDENRVFISGALPSEDSQNEYSRFYIAPSTPENAKFIRFSATIQYFNQPNVNTQIGYVIDTDYSDYFFPYIMLKPKALQDTVYQSMTFGNMPLQAHASTFNNGDKLQIEENSIQFAQNIIFYAKVTSFDTIYLGHGQSSYGYYIKVDNTNMTFMSNGSVGTALPHGLTIADYIMIMFSVASDYTVTVLIATSSGSYKREQKINLSTRGLVFAENEGSVLTDATLTWNCDNYKKAIWAFGDSYFSTYASDRWTHYPVMEWGFDNMLVNAYPGENSLTALSDLRAALNHGTPKYILWCLGMNDSDGSDSINANWLLAINSIKEICAEKHIDLILATIPQVTNASYNNAQKNAYVRNSGYHYIDFASAVDGVNGWLSNDNVHPSELGARLLASKAIADFPAIAQR